MVRPDFCVAIMGYLRPENIINRVEEINSFCATTSIIVGIDLYEGDKKHLIQKNQEIKKICMQLLAQHKISAYYFNKKNLGTKANWFKLIKTAFKESLIVIYIEDDVAVLEDLRPFISEYKNVIKKNGCNFVGSLQPNIQHKISKLNKGINSFQSAWLNSWGVVINKDVFELLYERDLTSSDIEFTDLSFLFYKSRYINLFLNVWKYKFEMALISKTAWDTDLMNRMWKNRTRCLMPMKSYTQDLGIDLTSISQNKVNHIQKLLHKPNIKCTSNGDAMFCLRCEKFRFFKHLSPWQATTRTKYFLTFIYNLLYGNLKTLFVEERFWLSKHKKKI